VEAGTFARVDRLRGHTDFIRCLHVCGNVALTAASSTRLLDCSLKLWDLRTHACSATLMGHTGPIWSCAWRGGDQPAVTASEDGTVKVWADLRDGTAATQTLSCPPGERQRAMHSVALSRDSTVVAAGSDAGSLLAWTLRCSDGEWTAQQLHSRTLCVGRFSALQLSNDGTFAAWSTTGGFGVERLGPDAPPATPLRLLTTTTLSFDESCTGALSDTLLLGTDAGLLVMPGALAGIRAQLGILGRSPPVLCHQQGAMGSCDIVLVGNNDGAVALYDVRTPSVDVVQRFKANNPVYCLQSVGPYLASGHSDGVVIVRDMRTGAALYSDARQHRHRERVWALSLDERRLVSAGLDGDVMTREFA